MCILQMESILGLIDNVRILNSSRVGRVGMDIMESRVGHREGRESLRWWRYQYMFVELVVYFKGRKVIMILAV